MTDKKIIPLHPDPAPKPTPEEQRNALADDLVQQLGITKGQAIRRIDAFQSVQESIIFKFNITGPDDPMYEVILSIALSIPQQ